jgi:hypothetical protein
MIYSVSTPSGIDLQVQKYQTWLYNALKLKWNIQDDIQFDFYGKIYRNAIKDGKFVPEAFIISLNNPKNTVYKEILFDQINNSVVCFVFPETTRKFVNGQMVTKIGFYFIINTQKINNLPWRASEEIRQDIYQLMYSGRFNFEFKGSETDFKKVFSEFDGWVTDDNLQYMCIAPFLVIRIDTELTYNIFDTN